MAKPIFLLGFPNSVPLDELNAIGKYLKNELDDYHVIPVRNKDNNYIAKVYSEKGSDILELDKIEKLLNKKL